MRRTAILATALALAAVPLPAVAAARYVEPLVVDLSDHLIRIDSSFTGTTVLLFGATDAPGDVIVVLEGPRGRVVVRRKERIAGIWVNRQSVTFVRVPRYYALAASRPPREIAGEPLLASHEIGLEHLRLAVVSSPRGQPVGPFRRALVRLKERQRLYSTHVGEVAFIHETLFRTSLYFPANVPTGAYTARVYLVRDGRLAASRETPLLVEKTGLGAEVFRFAYERPALYGLIAVASALVAGWLGSLVFRKA